MGRLRVASMFAGIGGICSGFIQAGCNIVWANEISASACRTYRHNFGASYLVEEDIKKIGVETIPDFDILTAGFPCQAFSIGGAQKGFSDCRGTLFFEVARVIDMRRPQIVFLENVENFLEHDEGRTFLVIYNVLVQYGYTVRYKVMATNEYGNVPQARKRIYIVAFREEDDCEIFRFPKTLVLNRGINDIIKRHEQKKEIYYYKKETEIYSRINLFIGNSKNLFRVYKGQIRNLRNPNLCPTITASMNDIYNAVVLRDDFGVRRLNLREALDFQGFPADFYFPNSITAREAYKQIGNSVSVPVIKRIAEKIVELFSKTEESRLLFVRSPEVTYKIMSAVKSKDTKPEIMLRKALWAKGLRYIKNVKTLPGKPDMVFAKAKIAVFCDGDFWHGHNWALRGFASIEEELSRYSDYWRNKILANVERDKRNNISLEAAGWTVLRFWESDIKADVKACADIVENAHKKRSGKELGNDKN